MAEIWGAAIMVGGALISGYASQKEAKEARKDKKAGTRDEAKYSAMLSQFEQEQEYYYQQLEKKEKMRGLDEFKKFNGMGRIDPNYVNTNTGPVLPEKPNAERFFAEPPKPKKQKKKRGGFRGFIDRVDPLGSALIDIDPISSAVLGSSTYEVPVEGQRPTVITNPQTGGN